MKKYTSLILAAIMIITLFTACSSSFKIEGSWEQTSGASGWSGSNGRVVVFNSDNQCNIFSPMDTYGISDKSDDGFKLSVTGYLGGDLTYYVKVIDKNHIEVYNSDKKTLQFEFTRLK